jgi:hypothetical protein
LRLGAPRAQNNLIRQFLGDHRIGDVIFSEHRSRMTDSARVADARDFQNAGFHAWQQ